MGSIMAVVAVLEIHMDRNMVVNMKPSIRRAWLVPTSFGGENMLFCFKHTMKASVSVSQSVSESTTQERSYHRVNHTGIRPGSWIQRHNMRGMDICTAMAMADKRKIRKRVFRRDALFCLWSPA